MIWWYCKNNTASIKICVDFADAAAACWSRCLAAALSAAASPAAAISCCCAVQPPLWNQQERERCCSAPGGQLGKSYAR